MNKLQPFEKKPIHTSHWLDEIHFPDIKKPTKKDPISLRVEILSKLCVLWDFGLLPDNDTTTEIRKDEWKQAVESTRLLTSPAYHLLRRWHGLPSLPYLGQSNALIRDDPCLRFI
jgi:hypothetical protein